MSSNHVIPSRPIRRRALTQGVVGASLLLTGLAFSTGCDSTATLFPQKVNFQRAMIVGAHPAMKKSDGTWVRQCGPGVVDGLITDVALISTQRRTASDATGEEDRDLSIRPGDVIDTRVVEGGLPDDINLTNEGKLGFSLDCFEPQPARAVGSECASRGGTVPSATLDEVRYVDYGQRRAGHNVLVLIDMSGSMSGIVDTANGNIEGRPGDFIPSGTFGDYASDSQNHRLAATRRLLRALNTEDRVGVIAFGEKGGIYVPCTEAQGDLQGDLGLCFGKRNTDIWLGTGGIDQLIGIAEGRSNLWQAVDTAYSYLRGLDDRNRTNHVIVLTDGPDTCSQTENRGACQSACSATDQAQVLNRIETDANDPNAPKVHVHFVQFESLGYPGRDPRQMEIACASGGQYQYLNSNQFPRAQLSQFQEALETAVINVRYMLMGHWQLATSVPAYTSNAAAPTGTLPGSLYAESGIFTVKASTNMVKTDKPYPFDVGQGELATSATSWDRRPTVRKPCTSEIDCGAAPGAAGSCTIICSDETLTCPGNPPATGVTAPDTFACDLPGGASGFCCQGTCEAVGTVCATCQ